MVFNIYIWSYTSMLVLSLEGELWNLPNPPKLPFNGPKSVLNTNLGSKSE